ncbi:hypothetical protein NC652_014616 [Populus alba x Populus x berolinensis]|uniref:Uncharacterized protein n=1 Tax=Populus alba x Populus x berolinensis TaxID=444605 RepID=A0AAD6W4L4_9ROSI|nr:hypothetical protein NC652_014616 [Populus alba x Populus x berolinensis]KAJ6998446.1 hypothetical protein NC653_014585 [Populus alba x Populus x berolinensis]
MDGAKEKGGDSGYSELSEVEVGICGADPIRITEWTHEGQIENENLSRNKNAG